MPKKYMTQEQIDIFRYGHLETQDEAFVCIVTYENKLSPNTPEYICPRKIFISTYSVQSKNSLFLFYMYKKYLTLMMSLLVHAK